MKKKISLRVIKRVSFYYEALLKLCLPDDSYISSIELEEVTGVSSNQVRQDFFTLVFQLENKRRGIK